MPAWVLTLLKMLIQFGGPLALSYAKKWLESKYPEAVAIIEELIKDLKNPEKSNREARKKAKECIGVACQPDLKK